MIVEILNPRDNILFSNIDEKMVSNLDLLDISINYRLIRENQKGMLYHLANNIPMKLPHELELQDNNLASVYDTVDHNHNHIMINLLQSRQCLIIYEERHYMFDNCRMNYLTKKIHEINDLLLDILPSVLTSIIHDYI